MYKPGANRILIGAEAVIDKDSASGLLAKEVGADIFIMATDVEGVYLNWKTKSQRLLRTVTPGELRQYVFPSGSMKPKVEAACQFVEETGKKAVIGSLQDIEQLLDGRAGTLVQLSE